MPRSATAFAPGHITGFFQIVDESDDAAARGSRGAGFSVERGVRSRVVLEEDGMPGVTVLWDGRPADAFTTRAAVGLLVGQRPVHVRVDQRLDLPVSQGFGMSAAGALSAALATAHALGLSREEAVRAAHVADALQRTGLGDVVGSALGGFEVRIRAGVPPVGEALAWHPDPAPATVLLAVVDQAVATRRVLSDPAARIRISAIAGPLVDAFAGNPDLRAFVGSCRRFAQSTGLETAPVRDLLDGWGPQELAGQCQLGGSVFVFDPSGRARADLERAAANVVETRVDLRGARILD